MVLLVESGGIYSCIWVRAIAFGFISISASLTLFQLAYLVITLADVAGVFHSNLTYMGPAGMLGTLMPAIAVRSGLGFFVCLKSTDCSQ